MEMMERAVRLVDPYLDLLRDLVEMESPSRAEECFAPLARRVASECEARGSQVERIPAPGLGENVLATFPGRVADRAPLLVLAHMDTVHPVGTLERFPFIVRDDRVWGPGVYDMKGGLSAVLLALDLIHEEGNELSGPVQFLVTCDEEIGSNSSRGLIERLADAARGALVVEPCIPGGAIKTRRKGMSGYRLHVRGKAAHAGIEPEKGASAIHELARLILKVEELADLELGTTLNVGVISGGTKINVVSDHALGKVDVRFWSREEAERVDAAIRVLTCEDPGCSLEVEGAVNRYALEKTRQSEALLEMAIEEARKLGVSLEEGGTGGASDGNLTSGVGCPTLDGLGPDGGGAHTLEEHVLLSDIPRRIALMSRLLQRL